MATILAYHNDAKIKAKYVNRVEAHRKADQLVQGCGWNPETKSGCAVGCCFDAYEHSRGPVEIGYPEVLMRLEDSIFEGLPKDEAMEWPTRFLKAAKPGADLAMVWPRFACWLLEESRWGKIFDKAPKAKEAVKTVHSLYVEWCSTGEKPAVDRWRTARAAAAYADAATAHAAHAAYAATAYAAYAADADAYAADAATAYAADAAAYAADADAYADYAYAYADYAYAYARKNARFKFWREAANELERLIQEA